MCKKSMRNRVLVPWRTLCASPAMCAAGRKTQQKQPPDRRARCALLSCHPSVAVPATTPRTLQDAPEPDSIRKGRSRVISDRPPRDERGKWGPSVIRRCYRPAPERRDEGCPANDRRRDHRKAGGRLPAPRRAVPPANRPVAGARCAVCPTVRRHQARARARRRKRGLPPAERARLSHARRTVPDRR